MEVNDPDSGKASPYTTRTHCVHKPYIHSSADGRLTLRALRGVKEV